MLIIGAGMKRNVILGILFVAVLSFLITGCKEENVNYSYKYEILVNGKVINNDIITQSKTVKNYIAYVNHVDHTADIKLTFNIYEKPLRDNEYNPTDMLKENFKVSTIYNDFSNTVASNKKVQLDGEEYNKYSITYTFDDIKDIDIIKVNFGDRVINDLELVDSKFEIRFMVN